MSGEDELVGVTVFLLFVCEWVSVDFCSAFVDVRVVL